MKLLFIIVSIVISSAAFASKARLSALYGADHIVDLQTVFTNAVHILQLDPQLNFEMGSIGSGAEGGLLKKTQQDGKLLVYLNHQNSTASAAYDSNIANLNDFRVAEGGYILQNNPVEIIYGKDNIAFGGSLSKVDNSKSKSKETTVIGKVGSVQGNKSYYGHLTLISEAEKNNGDKLTMSPRLNLGASMDKNDYHFYGVFTYGKGDLTVSGTPSKDIKDTNLYLGFEDRSMKNSQADIYYGAQILYSVREVGSETISASKLPVFIGIETNINTWSVFRGSVMQNLLLGNVKDTTLTNKESDGIARNTSVAAGLGFIYGNFRLDGTLTAATSGNINASQILTDASLAYIF